MSPWPGEGRPARMADIADGAPRAEEDGAKGGDGTEADLSASTRLEPYEVFRQEREGEPMRHGGSVLAPDPELAVHYARELYGRRQESVRLWVVRRADIGVLEDGDLLQPPLDRSFKKPGGYVMREKLATARERAAASRPAAATGPRAATNAAAAPADADPSGEAATAAPATEPTSR